MNEDRLPAMAICPPAGRVKEDRTGDGDTASRGTSIGRRWRTRIGGRWSRTENSKGRSSTGRTRTGGRWSRTENSKGRSSTGRTRTGGRWSRTENSKGRSSTGRTRTGGRWSRTENSKGRSSTGRRKCVSHLQPSIRETRRRYRSTHSIVVECFIDVRLEKAS